MIITFSLTHPVEDMYQEYFATMAPTQEQMNELNAQMNKVKRERGWIVNKCGRKNLLSKNENFAHDLAWCIRLSLYDLWLELAKEIRTKYPSSEVIIISCTIPAGFKLSFNQALDTVELSSDFVINDITRIISNARGKLTRSFLRSEYCIIDESNDKIPVNGDIKAGISYKEVCLPLS